MNNLTLEQKVDALYDLFFGKREKYFSQQEWDKAVLAARRGDWKLMVQYVNRGGLSPSEAE